MNSVALALYIVRVRDKTQKKYLNLNNIEGKTFSNIFLEYCEARKNISQNKELKKVINIKSVGVTDKIIHGEIETGNYGYTSSIKKISTSEVSHEKEIDEADMVPLFFCSFIPEDSYKGIMCLERFRTFGTKTILEEDFNLYLDEINMNARVNFHPMLPQDVAKQYFAKGSISKIRLIKNSIPDDIADKNKEKYKIGEIGSFEYVMNAKRNGALPFIKEPIVKFLNNEIGLKNIFEIDKIEYDNIKVELEIGRKKRTINLKNIDNLVGDIDISDDVRFEKNGHPNYDSIKEIAQDIVLEYGKIIDYKNFKLESNLVINNKEEQYDANKLLVTSK